ncbi:uncharacterized protein LOC144578157 [Callithrix jacchus]
MTKRGLGRPWLRCLLVGMTAPGLSAAMVEARKNLADRITLGNQPPPEAPLEDPPTSNSKLETQIPEVSRDRNFGWSSILLQTLLSLRTNDRRAVGLFQMW